MQKRLMVFLLMLTFALPALAQDKLELTEVHFTEDGKAYFNYPAGWLVSSSEFNDGQFLIATLASNQAALDKEFSAGSEQDEGQLLRGEVVMQLLASSITDFTAGLEGLDPADNGPDLLRALVNSGDIPDYLTFLGEVQPLSINDQPAGRIGYSVSNGNEGVVIFADYQPGIFVGVAVYAPSRELEHWEPLARDILSSIRLNIDSEMQSFSTTGERLSIQHPTGWLPREQTESSIYLVTSESLFEREFGNILAEGEATLYLEVDAESPYFGQDVEAGASPQKMLQALNKSNAGRVSYEHVEITTVGDRAAASVSYTGDGYAGITWIIEYEPGVMVIVGLVSSPDELSRWEADALVIAESVVYSSAGGES